MFQVILNAFRAAGEETRLRLLVLLAQGEITVTELTQILGQSQPRVSRHLKVLAEAGLVKRYREGAWMFYRLSKTASVLEVLDPLLAALQEDQEELLVADRIALDAVRRARADQAAAYFAENAAQWDRLRQLHLPESNIEQAMLSLVGEEPIEHFVDLGTGTGRMLTVFKNQYDKATGFDVSRDMLAIARTNIDEAGLTSAQIRYADLYEVPLDSASVDLVCIHQVLHFLPDPAKGFARAATLLKPGGRLIAVDFDAHDHELLRDSFAHRRLGFADAEIQSWCEETGMSLSKTETLAPENPDQDKLTVKIWLCQKPSTPAQTQLSKEN